MQPSRLFRIDDLLEEPVVAVDVGPQRVVTPMRVPTTAELSRQILRLAAMATIEHQRIALEVDACAADHAFRSPSKRAA